MNLARCFDKNKCDKGSLKHQYNRVYEPALQHLRNKEFVMLEIGVFKGESLQAWLDYFPKATIYCADIFVRVPQDKIEALKNPRVVSHKCDSTNAADTSVFNGIKFDVIIDDGLHTFDAQRQTFTNLFKYLKSDGVYFIEDVWPYDLMSDTQRNNHWFRDHPKDFSDGQFEAFIKTLTAGKVTHHDLRQGFEPDTYIIEVRPK